MAALPDGSHYMVWEFIDGENLAQRLRTRGTLPPRQALKIALQALNGLEAIPEIREKDPDVAIIVLSGFSADRMSGQVIERGADGYVEKGTPIQDLREATRTAVASRRGD